MGFRTGRWATVWEVKPVSPTMTRARISTSVKDKVTGQYTNDFSGWVAFIGANSAPKAAGLQEKARIRLGDVDVTNKYDKETATSFTYFTVFSFDLGDSAPQQNPVEANPVDGEVISEGEVPF